MTQPPQTPEAEPVHDGSTALRDGTGETHDPPRPTNCPRCKAALRPDQDWCLNCGAAVTTVVTGSRGWRIPLAIAAAVLLLAAGGLVFGFALLSNDAGTTTPAPSPTPPPAPTPAPTPEPVPPSPTAPVDPNASPGAPGASPTPAVPGTVPEAGASPTPGPPTTVEPGSSPTPAPTPAPAPSPSGDGSGGSIGSWPDGKNGFTVVLFSARTRSEASSRANGYKSDGISVGILNSSKFSSLRGGYWVVFSGEYDSNGAARRAADRLRDQVPAAYAREVRA